MQNKNIFTVGGIIFVIALIMSAITYMVYNYGKLPQG